MRTLIILLLIVGLVAPMASAQEVTRYRVIYATADQNIVALDPATGQKTTLLSIDDPRDRAYAYYVSPTGTHVAIFVRFTAPDNNVGARLYVINLGDESVVFDVDLLPANFVYPEEAFGNTDFELWRALGEVAWSPTGDYLAYVSGQSGNADVFAFNINTNQSAPVNAGPQTAAFLTWSPDGTYLLFNEVVTFGSGAGFEMAGFFVATPATSELRTIALPEPAEETGISTIGWMDGTTLLYSPLNFLVGASGLYALDIPTGESNVLIPPQIEMDVPVFDVTTGAVAFVVPDIGLALNLVPGAYLFAEDAENPTLLESGVFYFTQTAREAAFQFENPDGSLLYDVSAGALSSLPPSDFGAFVSPTIDAVVLFRADGVYISDLAGENVTRVLESDLQIPIWSPDGTRFYSYGFLEDVSGLLEIDAANRTVRVVDDTMSVTSLLAVAPG